MAATRLSDCDANLYRLYAVGLLSYEEALGQADSQFHLRRALLEFDQNTRAPAPPQGGKGEASGASIAAGR